MQNKLRNIHTKFSCNGKIFGRNNIKNSKNTSKKGNYSALFGPFNPYNLKIVQKPSNLLIHKKDKYITCTYSWSDFQIIS